jgi:hypothetical protein
MHGHADSGKVLDERGPGRGSSLRNPKLNDVKQGEAPWCSLNCAWAWSFGTQKGAALRTWPKASLRAVSRGGTSESSSVSRLELKPWWRSYGMTEEDRAVAVS